MFISNGRVSLISWNTNFYCQGSPSLKHRLSPRNTDMKIPAPPHSQSPPFWVSNSTLVFFQEQHALPAARSLGCALCQRSSLGKAGRKGLKAARQTLPRIWNLCPAMGAWKTALTFHSKNMLWKKWSLVPRNCIQRVPGFLHFPKLI